jgi:hypothetical protein
MYSMSEYCELRKSDRDIELECLYLSWSKGEKSNSHFYDQHMKSIGVLVKEIT